MGKCNDSGGGSDGSEDVYKGRAESVLVLLSDSYSEDDSISVHDSSVIRRVCGQTLARVRVSRT